ncbi:MAG: HEAT repeat domain-containing protein [Planctomycetota bacterium]|nr:HEAT repeat domain-containing protein [Planctomycetota bacterium]
MLIVAFGIAARADDSDWHKVQVPDVWKRAPAGKLQSASGFAWYRCVVNVPAAWKAENLRLFVEAIDDARTSFFNGTRVGATGTFPPTFRSGLGEKGEFRIPADLVKTGPNVVAIRVYFKDGRTNFSVAPPVLLNSSAKQAIRMEGNWLGRADDDLAWAKLVAESKDVEYGKVDKVDDVDVYVRRRKGDNDKVPPTEAVKQFQVADDLVVQLAVGEPHVRQPLFMNWDERGRLWVLQYLQYPNPAGLKMVSRDKYLRSVYDKVPEPPPHGVRGADKITIHEDTDGDGSYDKHKTFVDGLNIASSFARGRGGVWVLNPPYLLFYPDKNNDDVPDGDPVVHLQGFGIEDSHSVANSLRWGPDGWLYAAQGSTVTGNIIRVGIDKLPVHSMGQLIWRYHPEQRLYEVFAEGGGNTFGVEIDSEGRVYSGHNGGDTRGFQYVQGGYFKKGFGKHGALSNPYTFGYFEGMAHHSVPRFTHNFVIYAGAALPKSYYGKLFGIEPLQGQIVLSEVMPNGSSFKTRDITRPVKTSDQWFRPVDIKVGPDGAVYFADLYEQRIDHSSHYAGRIDRDSGRIYRIIAKTDVGKKRRPFDYSTATGPELVKVLSHPNKWHRQEAVRVLGDRKEKSLVPTLLESINDQGWQTAMESLWALHAVGGLTDEQGLQLLEHPSFQVRLWAVRLLCDRQQVSAEIATKLSSVAAQEAYVHARSQLACSARRLPAAQALPIIRALLDHSEDADDIYMPLLLWWAVEAKVGSEPDAVVKFFSDPAVWKTEIAQKHILERLMRRFALSGTRGDLLRCAELFELSPSPQHVKLLMSGFEQAFKGRSLADAPAPLLAVLAKTGAGSLSLKVRQGDKAAIDEALKSITDTKAATAKRIELIRIFAEVRKPESISVLTELAAGNQPVDVRAASLTSLQSYDNPEIATDVIAMYAKLPVDLRANAVTLLTSRKASTQALLKAVDAGQVDPDSIAIAGVRKMLLHDDEDVRKLVRKHWGDVAGSTTEQMRKKIEGLTDVISKASGNPYVGKVLYLNSCGKCHRLFTDGGEIGPDLTSFKRDDLQRMLLNVVNPNAEIREGFENHLVVTEAGRIANGFLADQDNQVVVLRGADGQNIVIPRADIDVMKALPQSVMPEGLLDKLTDQQVRDLFAYLRASQPLP